VVFGYFTAKILHIVPLSRIIISLLHLKTIKCEGSQREFWKYQFMDVHCKS